MREKKMKGTDYAGDGGGRKSKFGVTRYAALG